MEYEIVDSLVWNDKCCYQMFSPDSPRRIRFEWINIFNRISYIQLNIFWQKRIVRWILKKYETAKCRRTVASQRFMNHFPRCFYFQPLYRLNKICNYDKLMYENLSRKNDLFEDYMPSLTNFNYLFLSVL